MDSLAGVRVLDLSRVLAGPWCTQNLADLGADVIKVERPGSGDDTRRWGPPYTRDAAGAETDESAYFLSTNRNKRSVVCDITQAQGQAFIRSLVRCSDVLVENFKVGDLARHGLDWPSLRTLNPRLVYCSITGFGHSGPYRAQAGYDAAIQAMGGLMSITGEPDDRGGAPQKVGVAVADLFTGMYATVAILAALRHAERTGQGQHIDMALLDSQVAMLANVGAAYLASGTVPQRHGTAHPSIVPYQVFEVRSAGGGARDFIALAVGNDAQFARFCEIAERPDLARDTRFLRNEDRVRHRAELVPLLEGLMRGRTSADWLAALRSAGVPCGPIQSVDQVLSDPQVVARGMVTPWARAGKPTLHLVASPMKLSETPVRHHRPPPALGEHTDEVRAELGSWLSSLGPSST